MKILVIDDDRQVNKLVHTLLISEKHEVVQAYDGAEGLSLLNESPDLDLVITDIIMPDKEGIEIIREIRKNHHDKKIIAISGGGRISADSYLNIAKSLGADEILEKPFSKSQLMDRIKQVEMREF